MLTLDENALAARLKPGNVLSDRKGDLQSVRCALTRIVCGEAFASAVCLDSNYGVRIPIERSSALEELHPTEHSLIWLPCPAKSLSRRRDRRFASVDARMNSFEPGNACISARCDS
jgi:hypothetical protein